MQKILNKVSSFGSLLTGVSKVFDFYDFFIYDLLTPKRHVFNFDTNALTWYLIICQKRDKESKLVTALAQYGSVLRIHWRLSTILKTSNKSVWSNVFWYVDVCIFWKCIQYTIHWDKTQILKKNPLGQNKWYKKCPLLFPSSFVSSNSSVLLLIFESYTS